MASHHDGWVAVERKKKAAPGPHATTKPLTHAGEAQPHRPFKTFDCKMCNIRCTSKRDLEIHLSGKKHAAIAAFKSGASVSIWPCHVCQLPFESAVELTLHNITKEHANRVYQWLAEEANANLTAQQKHSAWRCYVCDVGCTGPVNLQSHVIGLKHKAKLAGGGRTSVPDESAPAQPASKFERPRPPAAALPGGQGLFPDSLSGGVTSSRGPLARPAPPPAALWTPEWESHSVAASGQAASRDPDQEFLDMLLGTGAGPPGGDTAIQQPPTPAPHSGRPLSASDAEESSDRHAANGHGSMPVEEILQTINGFFRCSLTQAVMVDPVVASDGYTYEREAIEDWIKHNRYSPVTKKPLTDRRVLPNLIVKQATIQLQRHGPRT